MLATINASYNLPFASRENMWAAIYWSGGTARWNVSGRIPEEPYGSQIFTATRCQTRCSFTRVKNKILGDKMSIFKSFKMMQNSRHISIELNEFHRHRHFTAKVLKLIINNW